MGQFAAVIVPQYCGAPAEKLGVLEWAIALKALEMAEQSHPFPAHPTMGWMGPCCQLGGVPSAPNLAFWELGSSWRASTWGQLPVPKAARIIVHKKFRKERVELQKLCPQVQPALPHLEPLLASPPQGCPGMFWIFFCSHLDQRLPISGRCPGAKSFLKLCKRYQLS